ncbi:glycine zipper 2TM domain-containing protein [Variovorax sp. PCZ-1]|uniref:glycine zipper 2TM domain-containing protein n=1 Tax=Variovorax sp. PCZ-1 TaxID=2835533 RepID=UPI001BCDB3EC|nr:glycine zipper 2TM domain-containing protein [Variovorax sp. PCZ-1]MBS7806062.1 glycine zipper 2TM domain-containing protein [Variovorax sp. PCZ-1]
MNTHLAAPAIANTPPAASTKPLWAAVGVLSVCVLAMGATLVQVNKRPEPLAQASLPLTSALAMSTPATQTSQPAPAGMITEEKMVEKPTVAGTKSTQAAPKVVAKPVSQPAPKVSTSKPVAAPVVVAQAPNSPAPEAASLPAPVATSQESAKPVCTSCGTIEAVTPITKEGQGSGVGVVAGGVLGGVVGNQIGKGNGRTVATVLGAIGGGVAGNAVEKNMKKTTVYSVRVRMEDGSSRTIEQATAPTVGSKVTLDGNTMRPA